MGFFEDIYRAGVRLSDSVNKPIFKKPMWWAEDRLGLDHNKMNALRQEVNPYLSAAVGTVGGPVMGAAAGGVLSTETGDSYTHAYQNAGWGALGGLGRMAGSYLGSSGAGGGEGGSFQPSLLQRMLMNTGGGGGGGNSDLIRQLIAQQALEEAQQQNADLLGSDTSLPGYIARQQTMNILRSGRVGG